MDREQPKAGCELWQFRSPIGVAVDSRHRIPRLTPTARQEIDKNERRSLVQSPALCREDSATEPMADVPIADRVEHTDCGRTWLRAAHREAPSQSGKIGLVDSTSSWIVTLPNAFSIAS